MNCLHCTAETTNGLALCETCRAAASVYLEFFPVYFRNLARWRPGRSGVRDVPSSREPRGPAPASPDRVSRALDEAGAALVAWAKALAEDRVIELPEADGEVEQAVVLCRWLNEHLTSIATLDWCGEFLRADHREGEEFDGIGYHHAKLLSLTETVIPGWYAGACHLCGVGTYVVPGLTWVTCGGCGVTTYARDHLETILDESRGWVARPMRLAEALVALLDTELSVPRLHKRISKWGEREQITSVRRDDYAPKRFRLGEVMDRLLSEGATRVDTRLDVEAC
jgi:hypothetical protein